MINEDSIIALKQAMWTTDFQKPFYRDYAFSSLPSTLLKLLTGEGNNALSSKAVGGKYARYPSVVLFLVDGFGWEFFERYRQRYVGLDRFVKEGIASQISSQFPSTTTAHLTTLHTGKEVAQTGIYEWFQYEPLVDRMVAPLRVSYVGDCEDGTLVKDGYKTQDLFPFETIYQNMHKKGIRSLVYQQEKIAHSAYSNALLAGSEVIVYSSFSDALGRVVKQLQEPLDVPTYQFVYFGEIDSIGHRQGIDSIQFTESVGSCWTQFEDLFWKKIDSLPQKTAILVTADHGMTAVDPKSTVLLNVLYPELPSYIKKNKQGQPLIPAGSCRDFFLHVEEKHLQKVQKELAKKLEGIAAVYCVQELLESGFFGSQPVSSRLQERIGNLVVLPYKGQNVFWHFEKQTLQQHFYGAHGGLTPEEMLSIFLFAER